jgi:hypothetical protein
MNRTSGLGDRRTGSVVSLPAGSSEPVRSTTWGSGRREGCLETRLVGCALCLIEGLRVSTVDCLDVKLRGRRERYPGAADPGDSNSSRSTARSWVLIAAIRGMSVVLASVSRSFGGFVGAFVDGVAVGVVSVSGPFRNFHWTNLEVQEFATSKRSKTY